jgi:hypothetical protein
MAFKQVSMAWWWSRDASLAAVDTEASTFEAVMQKVALAAKSLRSSRSCSIVPFLFRLFSKETFSRAALSTCLACMEKDCIC